MIKLFCAILICFFGDFQSPESHTIKSISYNFDPYTGDYIDEYVLCLDDESEWIIDWVIYERNNLDLHRDDAVILTKVSDDEYLITVQTQQIGFKRIENSFYAYSCFQSPEPHTIKLISYKFDPYTGDYIDEYVLCLDDDSEWIIDWSIYERKDLDLHRDDVVMLTKVSDDQYLMTIQMHQIGFKRIDNSFHAQ